MTHKKLLAVYRSLTTRGLNVGSAGNVSVRTAEGFLVTPSGLAPEDCIADDMAALTMEGTPTAGYKPSSEWRIHRDIYARRADAGAIIHTHAPFATALACQRREIPPFHYMIALFGGDSIRCANYATFGTETLSRHALAALEGRSACLLANHGMIVFGNSLDHALVQAVEFETLCEQYWRTCQMAPPVCLSADEMRDVMARFQNYRSKE